jgi:hypothetical protein
MQGQAPCIPALASNLLHATNLQYAQRAGAPSLVSRPHLLMQSVTRTWFAQRALSLPAHQEVCSE